MLREDEPLQARVDEAVGDHFLVAAVDEQETQALARDGALRRRLRALRHLRVAARNVVVAVDTPDFLDQVLFDRDVEAVARRDDAEHVADARDLHAEASQDVLDLGARNLHAEQARRRARGAASRPAACGWLRLVLCQDGGTRAAARDRDQQLRRAFDRALLAARIDAALEAVRRIGLQAERRATPATDVRRKERALEEHVRRIDGDAAVLAAHDAGETDRAGRRRR